MNEAVLGFDVGTSSSKAVLVSLDGTILAQHSVDHSVQRPHPGWVESDVESWWAEFVVATKQLLSVARARVVAVGVSGMGPCLAVADANGNPLRPAMLYGIDTRATDQIAELETRYGRDEILDKCGSLLSTQAVGPKLRWLAEQEPEVFKRARMLLMPSSYLVFRLTGEYVLDHHSASQCDPMYDLGAQTWYHEWASDLVGDELNLPPLLWPDEVAGYVTDEAAGATGLPAGVPVIAGTVDAWAEAISGDAHNEGDLMLMYGTTMFLINTVGRRVVAPAFWGTVGARRGTLSLAGGMATSGGIISWLRDLCGSQDVPSLLAEADQSGGGARGVMMLPYFAGERTPIADPDARGVICGLTLSHTRGDLYRAALEATAFGVRHNIDAMTSAGAVIDRVVAIGGGTRGGLWSQIVSDVTGLVQSVPEKAIGASYGAAFLAAEAVAPVVIETWNPVGEIYRPDPDSKAAYDELYGIYLDLYPATADVIHRIVRR